MEEPNMPSATQMIRQDHKKVEGLFNKFEQTKGADAKRSLAENAMTELEVHAALEEEIFYPAVEREVEDAASMISEAREEHQTVKQLIAELKGMEEVDEEFESQFSELMENVQHHVEEEENEMLPKVEESGLDLQSLGDQMSERRQSLQSSGGATRKRTSATSSRKSTGRKSTGRKSTARKSTSKKSASSKTAARKTASSKKPTGAKSKKASGSRSKRRA
jgi:hemerythrin superfamily protein